MNQKQYLSVSVIFFLFGMFLLFQDEVSRPLQDMAYRENPISNFGINITIEDALRDMLVISCFFMFILFLVLAGLSPKGKNE